MHAVDVVIGVGWLVFWVSWLAASVGVKAGRTPWQRLVGVRLVIVLIVVGLLQLHVFREHRTHEPALAGLGLAMFAVGLGLAIWARARLGRNWGTPMSEKNEPELVTTGPYRWIRHPIYSGIILAMLGTAVAVNIYLLVVAALLGGYFVYSAFVEQRFMAGQFPATYAAYTRATKMLVPFVF